MGAPYTEQTASSYNANPPADDGSESSENQVKWSTIKTKLSDPVKTLAEAIDDAVSAAFGKIIGGGAIASTADDYTAGAADQGKQIVVTVAAKTVTTPDATSVLAPFLFGVFNASAGAITLEGSGAQTVNGVANLSLAPGQGMIVFTDGTNWRAYGEVGTFVGKQMGYGQIINGTIAEANATNAVTYSLKTLVGADPSAADPVLLAFRSPTAGSGVYVYRTVTAALSLTISSGSTLGTANGVPFKVWLVIFDDGGTLRMGAINCVTGGATPTGIFPLGKVAITSSSAEGGAGAADSAQIIYTSTAVSAKSFLVLGYAAYESGMATAGAWNASPTRLHLQGQNDPLPGARIQSQFASTTTTANINSTTKVATALADSITPTSTANVISVSADGYCGIGSGSAWVTFGLWRGTGTTAIGSTSAGAQNGSVSVSMTINCRAFDFPASSSAVQYGLYGILSTGSSTNTFLNTGATGHTGAATITIDELMT